MNEEGDETRERERDEEVDVEDAQKTERGRGGERQRMCV